jgi:hypothetical protein
MSSKKTSHDWSLGLFLFVLRFVVYSNSEFLAKTFLSLYGLTHSLAIVPSNRVNAIKSLFRYGVEVIQQRLGSPIQSSNDN